MTKAIKWFGLGWGGLVLSIIVGWKIYLWTDRNDIVINIYIGLISAMLLLWLIYLLVSLCDD